MAKEKEIENARKKKLDAITRKIAFFLVQDTYTDEDEIQQALSGVCATLDGIASMLVASDLKNA